LCWRATWRRACSMSTVPFQRIVGIMREYDRRHRCLRSKRAKYCNTNRCACHSRQLTCNDRKRPPSIVRAGCAKALCWGAKGKRGLEVPGLAAHGIIDNLQLVFPELGRAAECPKECSKQKAAIPGTNQANSSPGKCSEQEAAIAATIRASPGPGECTEQTATVAATDHANP